MPVPARIARPVIAAATAVLVVGCGSSSTPQPVTNATSAPSSPTPVATASPGEAAAPALLLEVTTEGGFINPVARLGAVPSVVVDDDGRIFTPGAPAAGDTPPLVPPVDVRDTGAEGAAAIREAIGAAGLDAQEADGGIAADTGSTVFTTVVDGELVVNRFAAGGGVGGPSGPGGPGGDDPSRSPAPGASAEPGAMAFALLERLTDPQAAWGSSSTAAAPYRPQGYRVFAAPAGPAPSGAGASAAPAWPLATPLGSFGSPAVADLGIDGLRSGVVTGAEAVALSTAVQGLPAGSPVESDGQPWTIWIQPLFPDELPG